MRKLVIIIGAAAVAFSANAASAVWNSGVITLPSGTQAARGDVTAYLWESASSTLYDKVAAGTLDVIAEFGKADYGALGAYSATKDSVSSGQINNLTGGTDVNSPNQVYAVILYKAGTGADAKYLVNYAKSGDVGLTGVTVSDMAIYQGGSINMTPQGAAFTAESWAAPEPTSGLMLLLGVGLVALKRKRR